MATKQHKSIPSPCVVSFHYWEEVQREVTETVVITDSICLLCAALQTITEPIELQRKRSRLDAH